MNKDGPEKAAFGVTGFWVSCFTSQTLLLLVLFASGGASGLHVAFHYIYETRVDENTVVEGTT